METTPHNLSGNRQAAFVAVMRADGGVPAEFVRQNAPCLSAGLSEAADIDLKSGLWSELASLERRLLPGRSETQAETGDDAVYFIRRRRVESLRQRMATLKTLPSTLRKLALMSSDECSAFLNDVGVAALARSMKSIRPEELPAALHRLGTDAGRQVLQCVIAVPGDWPNDLRRLVRLFYLSVGASESGTAVLQSIGRAVLAVVAGGLTEAERAALAAVAVCDLSDLIRPPERSWLAFADPLRMLARECLVRLNREAR